jgi:hypothetical protein
MSLDPNEELQWKKRLRAHHLKLIGIILTVYLGYFAALVAVCYFATHRASESIEQQLRKSGHWKD